MDNSLEYENFMSGASRKVFVVLHVDWNDETTIEGVFSCRQNAEVYVSSNPRQYRRYIEEYEVDKEYNDYE